MAERPAAKAVAQSDGDWETVQPDEWQTVNAPPSAPPTMTERGVDWAKNTAFPAVGNLYTGATQGLESTLGNLGNLITSPFESPETRASQAAYLRSITTPQNPAQSIGKGIEQAAEFLLPGEAEEKAASMLPELLRPAARVAASALSTGAVNKAQGGGFGSGALLGGAGGLAGEGLRAIAPKLAETALHIGERQRGFGKTPGVAALEETKGVRPETILRSGQERMSTLMDELERRVNEASTKPTPPVRGFLEPPREEILLHEQPFIPGQTSRPMRLTQADMPAPRALQAPSISTPMAPGMQEEFPERMASADSEIRPTEFGPHSGMGYAQYIGEVPGTRGGRQPIQGVMYRRPEMSASIPPPFMPRAEASVAPARSILSNASARAAANEAAGLHTQLENMLDFLRKGSVSGEPIPENVTPRRLLNLKRGFSEEHLRWNPDIHSEALGAGRRAYRALDRELDRTVPEAAPLNQRVSSLIDVLRNADRESRSASLGQRALGRFGRHTGALFAAGPGAYIGYREGGTPGAIAGGMLGAVAPELVASPEGQMGVARMFHGAGTLRPMVGAAAQFTKRGKL